MHHQTKITIRNFIKKPVYSLITFFGFTIGIAASLLIYLWVLNELSFDKFHPDYQRIYRVLTLSDEGSGIVKSAFCYRPVARTLKADYPQIEKATYVSFSSEDSPLQRESGGEKIEGRPYWANSDFFEIFKGFRFLEGTAESAFKNPSNIVLSEIVAHKLFGDEPALGKTLISNKYSKKVYTVGGVVRIPKQSHLDFGFMLSEENSQMAGMAEDWSSKGYVHVYIKLAKNAKINDSFLSSISNHISRYSTNSDKLLFQPLADIHLYSDYETYTYDKNISSYKYVWIFSGLAFLIILMASFNFSVLSIARASERSTEIGIKKINGASRFNIINQFMSESVIQTFGATMLALLIIWFILPWFSNLSGKELEINLSFTLIANLLLIIVLTGLVAGIYPSLVLSSMKPTGILMGGNITGSKTGFIRSLVAVQFSIAIFFFISTTLFVKQLNYIRTKDLGLNNKDVVVIPTGLWYDSKSFKEELLKNPSIQSVSASVSAPDDFGGKWAFALTDLGRTDSLNASLFWVDEDFAKTYQLEVVKGEFLKMDYRAYWKEREDAGKSRKEGEKYILSTPIVINQATEKVLGFPDPIGQRLGDNVIVGVVKDFNFRPLHYPIGPMVLTNNPENIMTMNVKIAPENRAETLKYIRDTYQKHRDQRAFSYSFFEDLLAEKYKDETRLKNITIAFSILAIVISVLGILGMAVFAITRRTKEIGIRKVNGAKVSEVMLMLNKDFIKWVGISFVIATPIAWYAMHKWLENFAYKTELSWWIFGLAGLMALGIALLTVSWQSWKAATRNPVEALRYE